MALSTLSYCSPAENKPFTWAGQFISYIGSTVLCIYYLKAVLVSPTNPFCMPHHRAHPSGRRDCSATLWRRTASNSCVCTSARSWWSMLPCAASNRGALLFLWRKQVFYFPSSCSGIGVLTSPAGQTVFPACPVNLKMFMCMESWARVAAASVP